MRHRKQPTIILLIMIFGLVFSSCSLAQDTDEEAEAKWATSAHANRESGAFTRWNDTDPPEIPTNCAKCHSTHGYRDFLGVSPNSTAGQVDHPAPIGSTIECEACHNTATADKTTVIMPSGETIQGLQQEASCMECHQGRASKNSVTEAIAGQEADKVNTDLRLPGIHNNPVGATQYGTVAAGGFEFDGQSYLSRATHIVEFNRCQECHDAHTLQVQVNKCSVCHLGAKTTEDLPNIRSNNIDYDGDGDTAEGMAGEIETLLERLLFAMNVYAVRTEGVETITFNGRFQNEAGENYTTWTPKLLTVAYNYQYSAMDKGAYAHHGKYIIQLLYDSLNELGASTDGLTRPES